MTTLEITMYELGRLFLMPVLILILLLFAYAFYALGAFAVAAWQRRRGTRRGARARPCRGHGAPRRLTAARAGAISYSNLATGAKLSR